MKRILLLAGLLGFLGFLMATPGPAHKVNWCHYPPGQWTGVTGDASHVLILSIDIAAEPNDAQVAAHLGHSPSLTGGPKCDPTTFNGTTASGCAEGVTLDGKADGCPGTNIFGSCQAFIDSGGCIDQPSSPLFGLCCI